MRNVRRARFFSAMAKVEAFPNPTTAVAREAKAIMAFWWTIADGCWVVQLMDCHIGGTA